ncbi:MAG: hypothetical protein IJT97_02805 [Bacteroidaceae bacterium]|nr:hypothetical protein [Bacteroidaceae bacterium]
MKKNLLQSLLVMAGWLVGTTGAWAEATVNAKISFPEIETDVTVAEATDYAGEVNSMAIPASNAAYYMPTTGWLRMGDGTASVTIAEAERASATDVVTVSFDMAWGNKNSMGSGFRFVDAAGEYIATFQHARWDGKGTNANTLNIDMSGLVGSHNGNKAVIANATHFDITVNYAAKQITSVVTFGETSSTFTSEMTNTNALAAFEIFGYGAGSNADRASIFNNLVISTKSNNLYTNDFSNGEVTWTTATGGRFTPVILEEDGNKYLSVDQDSRNNNGTTITSTETEGKVAAGEDFTMSFRVKLGASNNQTATAFNIYDAANSAAILSFAEGAAWATAWTINGGAQTATVSAGNKGIADLAWIDVKVTSLAGGKTFLTIKDAEGEVIDGFNQTVIPTLSETGGLGKMNFVTSRYNANFAIDDIVVRGVIESEDIPQTPIYNYTVKFVDQNGDEFKTSETREEYADVALAITDEDKATVTVGKSQYIYESDDAEGQYAVEDGSTVITVVYNKFTVADYTVNYLDEAGEAIKDATVHKNIEVGTEVEATTGEKAQILVGTTLYNYVSGADPIVIVEDETANIINLVFAPVEGIEAYYLQNYEAATAADWTFNNGRYTPSIVNGSVVNSREVQYTHVDTIATAVVDSLGEAVLDSLGNPVYTYTYNTVVDSTVVISFSNKSKFLAVAQDGRNNNGTQGNSSSLGVDQANFTFEAKILLGSPNNQNASFYIKNYAGDANILSLVPTAVGATTWIVNGDAENFTVELPNSGTTTGTTLDNLNNNSWYNFKITVFKGYTFLTITDEAGKAILDMAQVPTLANTYGVGTMQFNTGRYYANFAIDDILVRNVLDSDKPEGFNPTAVIFNFVDEEGNSVKESETVELNADDEIVIRDIYKESFKEGHYDYTITEVVIGTDSVTGEPIYGEQKDSVWVDDVKYIYASDDAEGKVALADEVVNVNIVFRSVMPGTVRVRFKTIVDGTATNQKTNYATFTNVFEGDVITYYYPKYQLIDGVLYTVGDDASYPFSATYEVPEFMVVNGRTVQKIIYVDMVPSAIENAVYYNESEDIEGMTLIKTSYENGRMSNGAAASAIGGNVYVTTLQPGIYTLTSSTRSGTTNFLAGEEIIFTISSSGTVTTSTSEEFTILEETPIYIQEQGGKNHYSDYVMINKVGDFVVMISDVVLEAASEFDAEDGSIQIAVNYTPNIPEEYADDMLEAAFTCTVYDAAGEEVTSFEKQPLEITDGTFNFYLYDLEVSTEYTVVITGVNVIDYSRMDEETFEFPTIYSFQGEMASITFVTPDENPVGIAKVENAVAVKADGKYLEKGKVVIRKAGKTYNANGVQIK